MQCQAWKKITVIEGNTLSLTCPCKNINRDDHVEWRNPSDLLIFFNSNKVLKDPRSQVTLTQSKVSISISNVTFRDGGIYKCLQYTNQVLTKRYKVIVVSAPKLEMAQHEDKTLIKCSASAHGHPPKLSWLLTSGLEIEAIPNNVWENVSKKYMTESLLTVKIHKRRVTVKCLVQHLALPGPPLVNFIHLENHAMETSTISEHLGTTLGSTTTLITPTLVPRISRKTSTDSHSESKTTNEQRTHVGTTSRNSTKVNEITESTEGAIANFSTIPSNFTADKGWDERKHERGNSALLVFLVTFLIICLVVVLAFFLLRLRRAHIAWKKENEESDQSVESSRSKSSNEEKLKQSQEQRGQGFWNTNFTKYKVEEISETEPKTTSAADEKSVPSNQNISKPCIKETEL
ncbi:hypothetical protein P4O66_005686 [Electrophorus voltai]|uniref:Ig-like domain-containing protein n=1 Tax=Electrophorus voltai TaxID=2609070 RepID=A0AAD8ZJX8_9TELE|nr:hypothetical protein P4O66_005686 [Electrophorus voltai]